MATSDRSSLDHVLTLARTLAEREGLSPPVPILEVLRHFADVEHDVIPYDIDGVMLDGPGRERPLVVLSQNKYGGNRERFTAAHELGHIIMPWQAGTVSCHPTQSFSVDGSEYRGIEVEANRFAGELLVPVAWLEQRLDPRSDLAEQLVSAANSCAVSPMVVVFSATQTLPDCSFYVTQGSETKISANSPALGNWGRTEWSSERRDDYLAAGAKVTTASFRPYNLHVIQYNVRLPKRPQYPAPDILDEIIGSLTREPKQQRSLIATINGIVGSANDRSSATTPEAYFQLLTSRFANRPTLRATIAHKKFRTYLAAHAYALAERRGKK